VSASSGALEAIDRILDRSGDADDVLRDVVAVLHGNYSWVGISFVEEGELVLGPAQGEQTAEPTRIPISYENNIAPYCLVGWDTGGEAWSP
jgi:putative methionine-R-sulfoxide reductase with GAF domain